LFSSRDGESMYTVWIRADHTLPWIELKGEYETKSKARRAAQTALGKVEVKIVNFPEKTKTVKVLATARAHR
jgi:hypothetical protein